MFFFFICGAQLMNMVGCIRCNQSPVSCVCVFFFNLWGAVDEHGGVHLILSLFFLFVFLFNCFFGVAFICPFLVGLDLI